MPKAFDARHLSSDKNYQVQMTNWYQVQIGDMGDAISLLTQSCSLPEISTPVVELPYGNSKAKVPGQAEFADDTVTIMDAITIDVENQIVAWQSQVYDPKTGKMGWIDQYKRDMAVTQYGPDGTFERIWRFVGCWPSAVTYGEMSGDSSDKKLISMTISYDYAYRE